MKKKKKLKASKKKSIKSEIMEVVDTIKKNHKNAEKRFDDMLNTNFKRVLNVE